MMELQTSSLNMRARTSRNRRSGFTLIEVMVALGLLAFGILAIASMQEASLLTSGKAYNLTDGTAEAMDKMEYLVGRAYTDGYLDSTNGAYIPWPDAHAGKFTIDYAVTTNADDPNLPNGCKLIRVRVTWTDAGGGERSTVLVCAKQRC
jgi:prepilin-type N-terminal cleavage/methylation domain-containing protein